MRNFLVWLGCASGLVLGACLASAFYTIYATESKAGVVSLNTYGEADIEATVLIPILLIFAVVGFVLQTERLISSMREGRL